MTTISENTVAQSTIADESQVDGLYQFEFELAELRVSASDSVTFRPALREFFTETAPLAIVSSAEFEQLFQFDDSANLTLSDADVSYRFRGLTTDLKTQYAMLPISPISANAVTEEQWEGPMDFQPSLVGLNIEAFDDTVKVYNRSSLGNIEVTALDNQGPGVVRPEDGQTEYPHFRPVLRVEAIDTVGLELGLVDTPANAYLFASVGVERLLTEAGIPISPISANPISVEQYEGLMDFQPSLVDLKINDTSTIEVEIVYPEDFAELDLAVTDNQGPGVVRPEDGQTEYPHFRPVLRVEVDDNADLSISASDVSYLFSYPISYTYQAPGIPLGPVSISSVAEEQAFEITGIGTVYETGDNVGLNIAVTDAVEVFRTGYVVVDSVGLTITGSSTTTALYPRDETAPVTVSASAALKQRFVYVDSVALQLADSSTTSTKLVYRTTAPVEITASAAIVNKFNTSSSAPLVVDSVSTQLIKYVSQYTIPLEQSVSQSVSNTFKPYQGFKFRKSLSVNQTATLGASQEQYSLQFNANTVSTSELQELVDSLTSAVDRSGYTHKNQNLFLVFYKNGQVQYAVRQASVSTLSNPTRYVFNKPRFQYSYNTSTQVGTLIWDTQPQSGFFTLAATFNGTVYPRTTTTDFEFDEVRMYSGTSLQLWSAGIPYPVVESSATATTSRSVDITDQSGFVVGETHVSSVRYNYADTTSLGTVTIDDVEFTAVYDTVTFVSFTAEDQITQVHAYDDTAEFVKLVADSFEIVADYDTLVFNAVEATDAVSIAYSYETSGDIELTATYPVEIIRNYTDQTDIDLDSSTVETVSYSYTESAALETTGSSTQSIRYVFDDSATLGTFVIEDIDYIVDVDTVTFVSLAAEDNVEQTFKFAELADTVIDSIFETSSTRGFIESADVELADNDSTSIAYNLPPDSYELETTASSLNVTIFSFDDSATLGTFVIEDIDYIVDVDTVTFVSFAAEDQITQVHAYDDTAEFVKLVADSFEITVNFDTVLFNSFAVTSDVDVVYAFDETSGMIIEADYYSTVNSSVSRVTYGHVEWQGYSFAQGYTLFKQIYANDVIEVKLAAESSETLVLNQGKQIWIG